MVKNMYEHIVQCTKSATAKYVAATGGAFAIAFAVMLPLVMGATGMALDLGQSYHVKQRLCGAVDASILAAAAGSTDADEIENDVNAYFDKNYPADTIGTPQQEITATVTDDDIIVSVTATYETGFMRLVGIDELQVECNTTVHRNVQGLEVALVLDVTGSMSTNDNISALRTAATNFINILYDNASDDEFVKIGIVPYSSSVNVGPLGICQDSAGDAVADCTPFVNIPEGINYTTDPNHGTDWMGCVLAYIPGGWDENSGSNDPDPWDTVDHIGPWDIYSYETKVTNRTCVEYNRRGNCREWEYDDPTWEPYYRPNNACPVTPIMPLTTDKEALLGRISVLEANGYTLGNFGMVWGYRVLSPEEPFNQAEPWSDTRWNKVAIMMTDGANTMSSYTAYWRNDNHNISSGDLNDKFAETCDNMKDDDIIIYTITFTSNVSESTKDYYRDCATSRANYHDAPTQDDLVEVFENISKELSILHISQ
jgi:Flp pilus assembly protein TadG